MMDTPSNPEMQYTSVTGNDAQHSLNHVKSQGKDADGRSKTGKKKTRGTKERMGRTSNFHGTKYINSVKIK